MNTTWKNVDVTLDAATLLDLMAATGRHLHGSEPIDSDIEQMRAAMKDAMDKWQAAITADRRARYSIDAPQPLHVNGEGEMVAFKFAPESTTQWTIHDYTGNQVDGYDCRQDALEAMGDAVWQNDCDLVPSIHFLVYAGRTIVKMQGRRKARRA